MKRLAPLLRLMLAGIFLYAGVFKLGASESFAVTLMSFLGISPDWMKTTAISLAWVEVIAGFLLLMPRVYFLGAALILGLSFFFIGILTWALANGIVIDCNCFGFDSSPSAMKMLMAIGRDVIIAAAAMTILIHSRRS